MAPRWVVLENVVHMRPWDRYHELLAGLEGLGYRTREQVLNAADFGVPQNRRRLFILCTREGEPPTVYIPKRRRRDVARDILDPGGTWPARPLFGPRRAAATIERAGRGFAELGLSVAFLLVYYGTDGAGGWQPLDQPIRTLTTLDRFGLVEWDHGAPTLRMLQVPELKRAMGFGRAFRLPVGTRRDRIKLLGNGVCPPVMRAVVQALAAERAALC